MEVTAAVATFGDAEWRTLARTRAVPSAEALGIPWVHAHRDTLTEARNTALELVATEFVIHLDADDELEEGYVEAMATGTADLRAPSVRYIRKGKPYRPRVPRVVNHAHDCVAKCLLDGNWLVIGTAVRTELLRKVGGWRDFDWSEDWDAFLRCYLAGATVEAIPEAIYRAHVNDRSRNRAPSRAERLEAHKKIHYANGLPERQWPAV